MWSCDVPRSRVAGGPGRAGCVLFSPQQRHFLVFIDCAILAFVPAVLNLDVQARLQTMTLDDLSNETVVSPVEGLGISQHPLSGFVKINKVIPSGLSSWFLRNAIPPDVLDAWFGLHGEDSLASSAEQQLLDLSVSDCGQFVGCIIWKANQEAKVKLCTLGPDGSMLAYDFGNLKFPLRNTVGEVVFFPSKLRFYPTETQARMVLISFEPLPLVMFCDLMNNSKKLLNLEVEKCFTFCRTEDRQHLCFLHVTGVCILDLASQRVVHRIPYLVNFHQLVLLADRSLREGSFESLLRSCGSRLISDDGKIVGFAWDSKNEMSLVITPLTEMMECFGWFRDQNRKLELNCDVSEDGRCTVRWIYDTSLCAFCIYSFSGASTSSCG